MNQPDPNRLDRFLSLTLRLWAVATAAFVVVNGAFHVANLILLALLGYPFLDFLRNARGVYAWADLCFRENSIDSFLRSSAAVLGGPFGLVDLPLVRLVAKSSVLVAALAVAVAGLLVLLALLYRTSGHDRDGDAFRFVHERLGTRAA